MTDPDYTHISVVLDRSGSMESIKKDTEGGFNTFLKDQRALPGRATISLAQFDNEYDVVYHAKDIKDAPKLRLAPWGSTALLDAIGKTIATTGEFLAGLDEDKRPGNVLFVVITDGQENASREWNLAQVKKAITEQTEKYGWTFSFLSSGLDAIGTASSMGIGRAKTTAFSNDSHSVASSYAALSHSTTLYRGGNKFVTPDKV